MNNMNPNYQVVMSKRKAREIKERIDQVRLGSEAVREFSTQTGWTAHRIAHFADWMISTGEALRRRYDHAAMHDCAPHTGALAH